jgi:uncharacterized membrane protein YedE/YeeE
MSEFIEQVGDARVIWLGGLLVGLLFGVAGQQSQFCLRSATIEFWHGSAGSKLAIWLFAFSVALMATQAQILAGSLDTATIRQLNGTGSMSGAILGGALFGVGMMLARGCASRLLILSATGNLRALVTGLLLTVAAQASLRGFLSPLRETMSSWWTVSGNSRTLLYGLPVGTGLLIGIALLVAAALLACRVRMPIRTAVSAVAVGGAVALGWWVTNWHAGWSFEPTVVQSVSFTGPSTDTLMALVNTPHIPYSFGIGLVPGVFLGALLASLSTRQFRLQSFDKETGMLRYLIGAVLMGYGSMLAGGCAVGAGVTGGSVMATTAWTALLSMWLAAGLADLALRERPANTNTATLSTSV